MAEQLTEALIKRLVWQPDQPDIVWDSEVSGLGVRLYKSGTKSFVFDYRLRGRQHRHVLGKVGAWSLDAARQHARTLRVDVDKGIDPFGKQGSAAPQWTLADAWKRYERDYAPKLAPRSAADLRSHLARSDPAQARGQGRRRDRVRRRGAAAPRASRRRTGPTAHTRPCAAY